MHDLWAKILQNRNKDNVLSAMENASGRNRTYAAILRKVFWKKKKKRCKRQSRNVIWDIINTLFPTLLNLLFLLFLSTRKHENTCTNLSYSFEGWRRVNSKPPTIPFGIVACTFSDNLSQNRLSEEILIMLINSIKYFILVLPVRASPGRIVYFYCIGNPKKKIVKTYWVLFIK